MLWKWPKLNNLWGDEFSFFQLENYVFKSPKLASDQFKPCLVVIWSPKKYASLISKPKVHRSKNYVALYAVSLIEDFAESHEWEFCPKKFESTPLRFLPIFIDCNTHTNRATRYILSEWPGTVPTNDPNTGKIGFFATFWLFQRWFWLGWGRIDFFVKN